MKMKSLLLLGIVALSAACSTESGYKINGNVEGLNGKVYLTTFEGKIPKRIDSTEAVSGKFTFKGNVAIPIYAAIETPEGSIANFFTENSRISINGKIDDKKNIKASSIANDLYNEYSAKMVALNDTAGKLYKADPVANEEALNAIEKEMNTLQKQFVKANSSSIAAVYVLYREMSYSLGYEEIDEYVASFDPAISKSVYLDMLRTMADALRNTAVGKQFTDFTTPDVDGKPVALSSVAGKGKYVLLDFWASWCGPCVSEVPYLKAAYDKHAPKNFEIFGVSLDRNKESWQKGIQELGLNWIHVSEVNFWTSTGGEIYGVRSIPANMLIDPNGVIIARNLRGEELVKKLNELIK